MTVKKMTDELRRNLMLALDDAAQVAYTTAYEHGFHDEEREDGTLIALMHSELSEALEALRNPGQSDHTEEFTGVEEEMADVIIRILDYSASRGLRLGAAVVAKMAYNERRPHKHGKEF